MVPKYRAPQMQQSHSTNGEATMLTHGAEVSCTAGAAKPDSGEPNNVSCWRSADGEDTSVSWCRSTRHPERMAGGQAEGGEPNNVSCWRSTRRHGRAAGKKMIDT